MRQKQSKVDSVAISNINRIVIRVFQTNVSRGSSYILTPETYANPACGLIHINNYDQKLFCWCTKTMHRPRKIILID